MRGLLSPPEVLSSSEERVIYCCPHKISLADCLLVPHPLLQALPFSVAQGQVISTGLVTKAARWLVFGQIRASGGLGGGFRA